MVRESHQEIDAYTRSEFEQMAAQTRFDKVEISETHISLDVLLAKCPECLA